MPDARIPVAAFIPSRRRASGCVLTRYLMTGRVEGGVTRSLNRSTPFAYGEIAIES